MKNLIVLCAIALLLVSNVFAATYISVEPEYLKPSQSTSYKIVNETLGIIFSRIKPYIRTNKYPKYFHDFSLIKDDGTQSKTYHYVKYGDVELIYTVDTKELKYVALRRPELQKCRILYDYPSGILHAVQIFVSDTESFVYSSNGKYVDYEPYIKEVKQRVMKGWKVPSRKEIESLAKNQKDLLVQIGLTLNKDGTINKTILLKSSRIKALDDNVIETIKHSEPFSPFPDDFFNDQITIILNFNFSL